MPSMEEMQTAMINRSIRTIKAELEYLCDASVITPQTLSDLLSRIPEQTALHAPISVGAVPAATSASAFQPPTSPLSNLSVHDPRTTNGPTATTQNEKQDGSAFYSSSAQPPPSYNSAPPQPNWTPAPLAQATALYAYTSADAGDLELQPNDHITVTEYMNAEWWKGRSARTGQEGIFPRSYVKVTEDKSAPQAPVEQQQTTTGYGNLPLQMSQMGDGQGRVPSKFGEAGKKFGKKLGNAAIFGAGATMGADLVNSIL